MFANGKRCVQGQNSLDSLLLSATLSLARTTRRSSYPFHNIEKFLMRTHESVRIFESFFTKNLCLLAPENCMVALTLIASHSKAQSRRSRRNGVSACTERFFFAEKQKPVGAFVCPNLWTRTIGLILLLMLSQPADSYGCSLHAQKQDLSTGAGPSIKFERITIEQGLSQGAVICILQDRKGFMWFGTGDGLNKYDGYRFTIYKNNPNSPNSLSDNVVISLYEDRSGVFWIGTENGGLNKFDREKEQFTPYKNNPDNHNSLSSNVVTPIYEDRSGVLWSGTWGGGLNKLDRKKESTGLAFTHYQHDPNNPNSLSDNNVFSICEDRSGVLWIGTRFGGLNKFDREKEKFTRYINNPNNPNSLSDNNVFSIYEDRSELLWIGTRGGLNKFDREKGQFTLYKNNPNNPNSLSDNAVGSIYEDRSGLLWIGTGNRGLNKFDRKKEAFTHYQHDPNTANSLSDNYINSIYEDRSEMLWIGTGIGAMGGGLNKFDRKKEAFTHYQHDPNNPNSLSDNRVFSIYEDRSGVLWIGTWGGGLNKLDRKNEAPTGVTFIRYQHDANNPNSLSDNRVSSIYEDRSKTLWIGTGNGGLNKFDREKGRFTHYRESDGLPNDCIYGILEDNHGNLWLSTNNGLSKFNPQTQAFKNYDVRDGLQSNEYNARAYHKSAVSGEMFFGGMNGFNAFHPDSVKDNPYIPPVVITTFVRYNTDDVAGKPIVEKGVSEKREIELSYKDNILTFEFAALNYRNTFKNQYAYKLEGFTDNWIQLGAKNEVTFTNLDPGEYTLRVKGSNNDGVWNETGTSVTIIITPPYWQTWWFRALFVIAVSGFLAGLYNYRISKQLEIERTRNRIARDLHDEVGSSLSSIALMSELMQEEPGLVEKTKRELQQIGATAHNIVDAMGDLVWTINPCYCRRKNPHFGRSENPQPNWRGRTLALREFVKG